MSSLAFPVIDPIATGKNILSLRKAKGLTVRDLQKFFGFEEPQAIYRWQYGKTLPSVDNLYALSAILGVPMEKILIPVPVESNEDQKKQRKAPAASSDFFIPVYAQRVNANDCGISQAVLRGTFSAAGTKTRNAA